MKKIFYEEIQSVRRVLSRAMIVAGVFGALALPFGVKAQGVDWGIIESACLRQSSDFDAAVSGTDYSVETTNYGKVNSGRTNFLSVKDWLSKESLPLNGAKQRELEIDIFEMRKSVKDVKESGPYGSIGARFDRTFWLQRICLNEAFLAEANRVQGSHSAARQPVPQGSGAQAQISEQDITQSIALAQQNQSKAEEKRKKDGRRRNRPDLVASDCLTPDTGPRDHGFSVFKNSCSEPLEYTYCTVGAQEGSLAAFVSCTNSHGNRGGGAGSVRARGESAAPMRGASEVHWLACKRPARAITRGFENGKLVGDCIDLGA